MIMVIPPLIEVSLERIVRLLSNRRSSKSKVDESFTLPVSPTFEPETSEGNQDKSDETSE